MHENLAPVVADQNIRLIDVVFSRSEEPYTFMTVENFQEEQFSRWRQSLQSEVRSLISLSETSDD